MMRADVRVRLHALIDSILDAIESAPSGGGNEYTTTSLPPLTTKRVFHEVCRSGRIQGARRDGRAWVCGREEWHAARSKRPPTTLRLVESHSSDEEIADSLIARAGFRSTRGTR